jgi:tripartite-type tricarboxylate transporter receptor subunit TctC
VVKALRVPEVQERFLAQGAETVGSSPAQYRELLRSEVRRWGEVIRKGGITGE